MNLAACTLARGDGRHTCLACGETLAHGRRNTCSTTCADTWAVNHSWPRAKAERQKTDGLICQRCGLPTLDPRIHHDPPVGRVGYRYGCAHHQDRLETLCPPCHAAEHRFLHEAERLLAAAGLDDDQPVLHYHQQLTLPVG